MEKIQDTIVAVMQELRDKTRCPSEGNPEIWLKNTLTKKERRHIKFKYFKKGIIGVDVDSSSWLYNFNLKKEHLIERLRQKTDKIKDIYFRLGEINK
ncbi:MAG: hypothetical protein NC923_04145 [Candidatus Omnitrophica bacterium]|nr:hypothetical protein [Candidatus Omnitrophota bacterium]